jgi:hypothetical protein
MGASTDAEARPRFPSPLIEPDVRISRCRPDFVCGPKNRDRYARAPVSRRGSSFACLAAVVAPLAPCATRTLRAE